MNHLEDDTFLYWYKAYVVRVVDSVTVDVLLDLGFGVNKSERIKLQGVFAWDDINEGRPKSLIAQAWLSEQINLQEVTINTQIDRTGVNDMLMADIFIDGACINDEMIELGHAIRKDY